MRQFFTSLALAAATCLGAGASQPVLAQAAADPSGDWHGVLATPAGPLTIILSVSRAADGSLKADLESPDQAPGQKIPATSIAMQDDMLGFEIAPLRASFKGKWNAAEQSWDGQFSQGADIALKLNKGLPPPKAR